MMINIPSAPGGAAAAPGALPGVATGAAALPASSTAEGTVATTADGAGMPALFAQLLDFAGLAQSAQMATAQAQAPADGAQPAADAAEADATAAAAPADTALTAMMPPLQFTTLPTMQLQAAVTGQQGDGATPARGVTLLAAASDSARQAAADAITAAATAATTPLAARLLQGVLPAAGEPATKADARQVATTAAGSGTPATQAGAASTVTVLATQDGSAQAGKDGQPGQQGSDNGAAFRGVMAAAAPAAGTPAADTVKLVGNPEQWQQPLRAALGDRLQLTLQKGNDQAVIRLEPPNLGSIEISIRQSAGSLHVSMSATNGEVVRQLNAVGDSMRQDLSQRQYGDVAVTVSQSSRSLADSDGRGRQPERDQQEQRGPGRALNEGDDTNTTFAMLQE